MSALLTTCAGGLKIGILIAVGISGTLLGAIIGYRFGQDLENFMVVDRSPALRALRLVTRIANDHGLTRDELLEEMLKQSKPSSASSLSDEKR